METARCRAFVTAAAAGSFTAAADILGYTPSGVSQLVAALESECGFSLLVRSRRGVALTEAGRQMLPAVREFIAKEESLSQLADGIRGVATGSVTIATYPSISSHWLPAVIKEFRDEYPGIRIRLMEGIRQEICNWLDDRTADMAFFTYMEPMEYDWFPLADDPMIAVLPGDHPCAGGSSYPLSRCPAEKFIMPALGHDVDVEMLLRDNGITPDIWFSTLENFAAISMIEQGLGMSIMNELCTESWEADVVKIPLDPPQHITFGVALVSAEEASPAAKRFLDCALKRLCIKK